MNKRYLLLLPLLLFLGCKKVDQPQPEPVKGAPIQIMVVFAPGQLGDKGYADNVMEGVNSLERFDQVMGTDSLDVAFISPFNVDDAKGSLQEWAAAPANPFSGGDYERRLLVLTEPFMVGLLTFVKDKLRPTDEILLLKLEEEDIAQVATQFSLGNRVHGLNISAEEPVRRFCRYIRWMEELFPDSSPGYYNIPVYRLYDNAEYPYRDGMAEAFQDEMGSAADLVQIGLSSQAGEGIYTGVATQTIVEAAFEAANVAQYVAEMSRCPYVLVDLGAGNAGWDYFLLGQKYTTNTLDTLMLDAEDAFGISRFYIRRKFGMAFMYWVYDWMDKAVGGMDAQVTHRDAFYIEDNIYDLDEA